MAKKPNAANITHALAQLGGGSKKEGGGGMMEGIKNVFSTGVALGNNQQILQEIKESPIISLEDSN